MLTPQEKLTCVRKDIKLFERIALRNNSPVIITKLENLRRQEKRLKEMCSRTTFQENLQRFKDF